MRFSKPLIAYDSEESLKGFDGSFLSNPKQARDAEIDPVNQRQVLVAFGVLDLVNADGVDLAQSAILQSEDDDVFHGIKNLIP